MTESVNNTTSTASLVMLETGTVAEKTAVIKRITAQIEGSEEKTAEAASLCDAGLFSTVTSLLKAEWERDTADETDTEHVVAVLDMLLNALWVSSRVRALLPSETELMCLLLLLLCRTGPEDSRPTVSVESLEYVNTGRKSDYSTINDVGQKVGDVIRCTSMDGDGIRAWAGIDAHKVLVAALEAQAQNPAATQLLMASLWSLCRLPSACRSIAREVVVPVTKVMRANPEDDSLLTVCCGVLKCVSLLDGYEQGMFDQGAVGAVMEVLNTRGDSSKALAAQGLEVLQNVAGEDNVQLAMVQMGCAREACRLCKVHPSDPAVCDHAMAAIMNMAYQDSTKQVLIDDNKCGLMDCVFKVLVDMHGYAQIAGHTIQLICALENVTWDLTIGRLRKNQEEKKALLRAFQLHDTQMVQRNRGWFLREMRTPRDMKDLQPGDIVDGMEVMFIGQQRE
ncbi:hypothetical protein KIPB_004752 [Kipferlia bialata]|uniref:Uncharacterized protein n=1 Tax=Kipferlia bialata TaxID=797122 RepID=A0A9K3CU94_9EUKA|nr:hypothetical protein KIPB_004752 [Kipferlia bialata]|eukprot:g4752.t1